MRRRGAVKQPSDLVSPIGRSGLSAPASPPLIEQRLRENVRWNARCLHCGVCRPLRAVEDRDPFCSRACCQAYYGVTATDYSEIFATRPTGAKEPARPVTRRVFTPFRFGKGIRRPRNGNSGHQEADPWTFGDLDREEVVAVGHARRLA